MIANFFSQFGFERRSETVQRLQILDSLKMTRTAAVGGAFNALVCCATFMSSHWFGALALWTVLALGLLIIRLARWRRHHEFADLQPRVVERRIRMLALASGSVWGIGVALAAFIATPTQFNLLAMLSGGMMGAAVITFGPLPRAAFCFIAPMAAGCVLAWIISPGAAALPGAMLIASYVVVLTKATLVNERIFVAKVEGELALRESAETVRLLLNDYEAQSADWLWTVDSGGRIENPSPRFAEASNRDAAELAGAEIVGLFAAGPERLALGDHIRNGRPFRDLILGLTIDGASHWWSLSGHSQAGGGMRGVASDVTAQKRAEARVNYLAHYDGLTGLANRFLFSERLENVLERPRRTRAPAVLCLDLDEFKSVNDTLGHPVGDKLLCEVARRIESIALDNDVVARLGGDEFAILIGHSRGTREPEDYAREIVAAMEEPFNIDGLQISTSVSIGVAVAADDLHDPAELMKQADLALYSAKSEGRGRFVRFEPEMHRAARERRELETDMRAALAAGEFELYYQPLVNLETGQASSYEALIRWNHFKRGLVMPAVFIPLAEETGFIVQLGEWVVRQATRDAMAWPDHIGVSVNLSPVQIRNGALVNTVVSALARSGLDPNRLELEITEGVFMADSDANLATLRSLKELGVRIALDDFGTGYSSLNYIRSFPFDKIKIDQCFVKEIEQREDCRAIVRAVTSLAESLGMTTTAEGIENPEQLERLRLKGCTEGQGYLFARPNPSRNLPVLPSSTFDRQMVA